jgi:hypothetical protein
MRQRYVMRRDASGEPRLVAIEALPPRGVARSELVAPMVISDIAPYRSMRTGEIITNRAQHREHLRQYGLVEVGNEWAAPRRMAGPAPGEIAQDIKRELARDAGERRAIAETALRGAGYDGPAVERVLKP